MFAPRPTPFARPAAAVLALALLAFATSATARPLTRMADAPRGGAAPAACAAAGPGAAAQRSLSAVDLGGRLADKQALRALRSSGSPAGLLAASAAPRAAGSGPFPLSCTSLDLLLDGFGAFGSSTAGGDARFSAGGAAFGTIFESMAFAGAAGFLEGSSLALPQSAAGARLEADGVHADFVAGPWRFELRSRLENCAPEAATLRQEWTITNVDASPRYLAFTLYLDGDLFARGAEDDDFGARVGDELVLFDEGADRDHPTAFVGLASEAPEAVRVHREVGEFSEQRRRVARGGFVGDRLVRADGSRADADGDGVTDVGFDASVAAGHDFGMVAPGESRHVVARVRWGVGSIHDVAQAPPVVDAGPDRVIECEGRGGTLVRLDASASPDAARIAEWAWGVDGALVAAGAVADVMLLPGRHVVSLEGIDEQGRIALDEAIVEVLDTLPPSVSVGATQRLWPPDHRMVAVSLPIEASDACSDAVVVTPVAVIVDEADDARGDGRTTPDARLGEGGVLFLRAERSGTGDGRVYRVLVEVRDEAGNLALAEARVEVPHDAQGTAVDSGAAHEVGL